MASKRHSQKLTVQQTRRWTVSRGENTLVNQIVLDDMEADGVSLARILTTLSEYDADLDMKKVKVEYGSCGSHEVHIWWVAE